jgi:hypothetical protein
VLAARGRISWRESVCRLCSNGKPLGMKNAGCLQCFDRVRFEQVPTGVHLEYGNAEFLAFEALGVAAIPSQFVLLPVCSVLSVDGWK